MEDTIMKKTYINPELQVIVMQTRAMLAGSPPLSDGDYDPSKPVLAPGMDWDDDFDEE